jgi:hypothetical protein
MSWDKGSGLREALFGYFMWNQIVLLDEESVFQRNNMSGLEAIMGVDW